MSKFDPTVHGVTQGLLADWMSCRALAAHRCAGIERPIRTEALDYGTMVHELLAELHGGIMSGKFKTADDFSDQVPRMLQTIEDGWNTENQFAPADKLQQLEMALLMAEGVLRQYARYWERQDFGSYQWQNLEQIFDILAGGTRRRGKFDGIYRSEKVGNLWLFETKTKGRWDDDNLSKMLKVKIQNKFYITALYMMTGEIPAGIMYDVVRRPQIRRKTGRKTMPDETIREFAERCIADVEKRPDWYFTRFELKISEARVKIWTGEVEMMLAAFRQWWEDGMQPMQNDKFCEHWGRPCRYLDLCSTGHYTGYERRGFRYSELEE